MLKSKHYFIIIVAILLLLALVLASLSCITIKIPSFGKKSDSNEMTQSATDKTTPHPPVRTGDITTGLTVEIASQSISPAGGIIEISKPGDSLDGFVIDIPSNSYTANRIFNISYAPIMNQSFGGDIDPVSPMISVDNGGGYSDEIMCIRVPIKVSDEYFAMGFLYDEKTRQLEGMPVIGRDSESITVATRHFTKFFISKISEKMLSRDIDSGFRPGIDDWQFPNYGSQITPYGNCEGMSLSAIWYYCNRPDGENSRLYGYYDNNGNKPATPSFWRDDSLSYRFCSVVQKEKNSWDTKTKLERLSGVAWKIENNKRKMIVIVRDNQAWKLLVYSMMVTHEPQEVIIRKGYAGIGHAMICYRISDGNLYIADPNYRGDTERRIAYTGGQLQPYISGNNKEEIDAGQTIKSDQCLYMGKTPIEDWNRIARHWTEFKNKTVGNDKFSQWSLYTLDKNGTRLEVQDGFVSENQLLAIYVDSNENLGYEAFKDQHAIVAIDGKIPLEPGKNKLGFYINKQGRYVDFKYMDIYLCGLKIQPEKLDAEVGTYSFTCSADPSYKNPTFIWDIDGSPKQNGPKNTFTADFKWVGTGKVSVTIVDGGKQLCTATAPVTIRQAAQPTVQTPTTTQNQGTGWYLDGSPVIKKNALPADDCVNFGLQLSVSDGSASGSRSWKDCSGGSKCSGKYTGTVNWTSPPSFMQPGSKINFNMSEKTTAQNTCGEHGIYSDGWVKVDGKTIVEVGRQLTPTATGTYTVRTGSPGAKLVVEVTTKAANMYSFVTYNYTYK